MGESAGATPGSAPYAKPEQAGVVVASVTRVRHVHAFNDDALGELDAVALATST